MEQFLDIKIYQIISFVLFALGGYFVLSSAVGAIRMPDFFTRLHPIGMSDSIGLPLILLGVIFHVGFGVITLKILLVIAISLITSSTSSHALANAALQTKDDNKEAANNIEEK